MHSLPLRPTERIAFPRVRAVRAVAPGARLRHHPVGDPDRAAVERFVGRVYAERYGASVPSWAPQLVSIVVDGEIVAAAGWRPAQGPLYLERYLAAPIERLIVDRLGRPGPSRSRIVEVGHLSATRAGQGVRLMARLGTYLASLGYDWVASTATPGVRATFERMGVEVLELGHATAKAAGPHASAWGNYYERGASVVAGELASNLARVAPGGLR
ncbi:MAG: thermostable hemolysin [Burkholderiales bacterium]|nr:thermostable hemolysin [Burkholderiales bacterium]